jgi:hypothetical protein
LSRELAQGKIYAELKNWFGFCHFKFGHLILFRVLKFDIRILSSFLLPPLSLQDKTTGAIAFGIVIVEGKQLRPSSSVAGVPPACEAIFLRDHHVAVSLRN